MYSTDASISGYYVSPETPIMSSVIADCPDSVPPIFWKSIRQCLYYYWLLWCSSVPLAF